MKALPTAVHPLAEVRDVLSQVVARFRRDGVSAEPVVFGSHRKPEAVLLPYELCVELLEQAERAHAMRSALASVRAEGLAPTADGLARIDAILRGEIHEDQAYDEMVRHYRRM